MTSSASPPIGRGPATARGLRLRKTRTRNESCVSMVSAAAGQTCPSQSTRRRRRQPLASCGDSCREGSKTSSHSTSWGHWFEPSTAYPDQSPAFMGLFCRPCFSSVARRTPRGNEMATLALSPGPGCGEPSGEEPRAFSGQGLSQTGGRRPGRPRGYPVHPLLYENWQEQRKADGKEGDPPERVDLPRPRRDRPCAREEGDPPTGARA
jgi:hypothetical protein